MRTLLSSFWPNPSSPRWVVAAGMCLAVSARADEIETTASDGSKTTISSKDDRVQRKAIRGGALDVTRESEELKQLRTFEHETFLRDRSRVDVLPPLGSSSDGTSQDLVPEGLRTPRTESPEKPASYTTPPWLAALKLLDNLGLGPTFVRFETHVIKYLEFYKDERRGRAIMASWLRRQGRYRKLIEQALEKYKLPRFLLYVSMIESGYDPHDRSHKGAVGLWQFLPEGARIYGLRVDHWVDERQDPERSTEAAARYLGDLKARFGSWHLALAAFNAGYGAVLRAMQKYNTNDYWELCRHEDGLPFETLLYVPKAIATALVGENRSFFGYEDTPQDPPLAWDSVTVSTSVSLAAAARAMSLTEEELARLNPHLRRGRTPPLGPGETFELRVPVGLAPQFVAAYDFRGEKLLPYVVRFGERLEDIAKTRGVATSRLRTINGIEDPAEVRPGLTLLVPPSRGPTESSKTLPNDDLVVVAVPDKNLRVEGKRQVFYRIVPGDTLWSIARFFKVKDADLVRWNNVDPEATLATKMVLSLWIDPNFDVSHVMLVDPAHVRVVTVGSEEFFTIVETLRGRRRVTISVSPGDALESIGRRYGLTVADMERINRMSRKTDLLPGQTIVAYQTLSPQERAAAIKRLLAGEMPAPAQDVAVPAAAPYGPPVPLYGPPFPLAKTPTEEAKTSPSDPSPNDPAETDQTETDPPDDR